MKSLFYTILSIVICSFGFSHQSVAQCDFDLSIDPLIFDCNDTELPMNVVILSGNNLTFQWESVDGTLFSTELNPIITNDPANYGIYIFTVIDEFGCALDYPVEVTTTPVLYDVEVTDVSCDGSVGGSIVFNDNGSGVDYQWSNGDTGPALFNLPAGIFAVTLVDADGCTDVLSFTIVEPTPITCEVFGNLEINCLNPQVSVQISCSGGTPPYVYTWSDGSLSPANSFFTAGTYEVTITDANGCIEIATIEVVENTVIECGVITGTITIDENDNCEFDLGEPTMPNILVEAIGDNFSLFGMTDANGVYSIDALVGDYTIVPYYPSNGLWQACTASESVSLLSATDIVNADFSVGALVDCPRMTVGISTPFLRRCFDGFYHVDYCNEGTQTAIDASIQVTLPDLLVFLNSSLPATDLGNGLYEFQIGDVGVGDCGSFVIEYNTSCDTQLGQTLCTEAHIFPDSLCVPPSSLWSGASIALSANCGVDEVTVNIENTGMGNMIAPSEYIVFEDGVMLMTVPGSFQLDAGQATSFSLPSNGSTYVVLANQVPNHPGNSNPTLSFEACGQNNLGEFSTGFVNQFPQDDGDHFIAIDCQVAIGSWDPNDKQAFPIGYAEEHFIERGQNLDYLIRFQNTGTDTAFNIIVEDVLSPDLDIRSLRPTSSSHPYSVEILGSDTLHFVFENIMLPDSNVNEPSSHGFIRFTIDQKDNLPLGTVIENKAGIYFDFNEAIITNTVFHTIGMDFYLTNSSEVFLPNLAIEVFPNPFSEQTKIRLNTELNALTELRLFSASGQLLAIHAFTGNELILEKGALPTGLYFYQVNSGGRLAATGKLVIE